MMMMMDAKLSRQEHHHQLPLNLMVINVIANGPTVWFEEKNTSIFKGRQANGVSIVRS